MKYLSDFMNFKTVFILGLMLHLTSQVSAEQVTIWSEDWSSASEDISVLVKDIVNDNATYSVSSTDVRLYNTTISAGGASGAPELFIKKDGGKFTATIESLKGCTGELTLTFCSNKDLTLSSSTKGVIVTKVKTSGKKYTYAIQNAVDGFTLSFKQTSTSENARLDDIVLKGIMQTSPIISVSDQTIAYGDIYTLDISGFASGDVTLTSSNNKVATVEGLTLTSIAVGTTTIMVSTAETEDYEAGEETFTLTVTTPSASSVKPSGISTTSVTTSGGFATFCYTYPLDLDGFSGAKAYRVSGVDSEQGVISLVQLTGKIQGGVPFVLKADGEDASFEIPLAESSTNVPGDNALLGTLAPTFVPQTSGDITYFAYSKTKECFVKIGSAGNTVPANRAYLPVNLGGAGVKALTFVLADTDGISTAQVKNAGVKNEDFIFNLAGQRLTKPAKGVNIVNGTIILLK